MQQNPTEMPAIHKTFTKQEKFCTINRREQSKLFVCTLYYKQWPLYRLNTNRATENPLGQT